MPSGKRFVSQQFQYQCFKQSKRMENWIESEITVIEQYRFVKQCFKYKNFKLLAASFGSIQNIYSCLTISINECIKYKIGFIMDKILNNFWIIQWNCLKIFFIVKCCKHNTEPKMCRYIAWIVTIISGNTVWVLF